MTKEEFIDKIKELNINVPDECFFLEYNKCVYDILEERDTYKKKIEKAINYINGAYEMAVYTKNISLDKENIEDLLDILEGDISDR